MSQLHERRGLEDASWYRHRHGRRIRDDSECCEICWVKDNEQIAGHCFLLRETGALITDTPKRDVYHSDTSAVCERVYVWERKSPALAGEPEHADEIHKSLPSVLVLFLRLNIVSTFWNCACDLGHLSHLSSGQNMSRQLHLSKIPFPNGLEEAVIANMGMLLRGGKRVATPRQAVAARRLRRGHWGFHKAVHRRVLQESHTRGERSASTSISLWNINVVTLHTHPVVGKGPYSVLYTNKQRSRVLQYMGVACLPELCKQRWSH